MTHRRLASAGSHPVKNRFNVKGMFHIHLGFVGDSVLLTGNPVTTNLS